jgi:hypothetical protein
MLRQMGLGGNDMLFSTPNNSNSFDSSNGMSSMMMSGGMHADMMMMGNFYSKVGATKSSRKTF